MKLKLTAKEVRVIRCQSHGTKDGVAICDDHKARREMLEELAKLFKGMEDAKAMCNWCGGWWGSEAGHKDCGLWEMSCKLTELLG